MARSSASVANILRRKRRALKLSQEQVAEQSGLRQATISGSENVNPNIRLKTLFTLLMVLDLELVIRDRTKSPKLEDIF